jgi:hypothetical protein
MPTHLVLFQIRVPLSNAAALEGREDRITALLGGIEGFEGFTLWQGVADPTNILGIYEYATREAAEEGMRVYALNPVLDEAVEFSTEPMQIRQVVAKEVDGKLPSQSEEGHVISLSFRVASPGLSEELQEDLDRVFDSLRLTPGYLGSVRGCLESLEDEAVGIVLWEDSLAFSRSLPARGPYEVQLYRRVPRGSVVG